MTLKIALVGSAPSSVRGAPYMDPSWKIWACSPGVYGVAQRVDEWFELHLWEPGQTWFSPEYVQWMTALPKRGIKLWTGGPVPIEGSMIYPKDDILSEFDPHQFFCTSSLFWMMAKAIKDGATTIGLWGIDMAANEEYEAQRAGLHYMAYIAASKGIEVGIPPESDLFTPRFAYGFDEWTHSFRKIRARRMELETRRRDAEMQALEYTKVGKFLEGAMDDLNYCHQTWAHKFDATSVRSFPAALERQTFPGVTEATASSTAGLELLNPAGTAMADAMLSVRTGLSLPNNWLNDTLIKKIVHPDVTKLLPTAPKKRGRPRKT